MHNRMPARLPEADSGRLVRLCSFVPIETSAATTITRLTIGCRPEREATMTALTSTETTTTPDLVRGPEVWVDGLELAATKQRNSQARQKALEDPWERAALEREERGLTGNTPWTDRFTKVHQDVYRRYSPEHSDMVAVARRHASDLFLNSALEPPTRLAARLGIKSVKHLRTLLTPDSVPCTCWCADGCDSECVRPVCLSKHRGGRLSFDVRLHVDENGNLDYIRHKLTEDGEYIEKWLIDLRPIHLLPVLDEDGQSVLTRDGQPKTRPCSASYWVPDMVARRWQDPATTGGDQWVRLPETPKQDSKGRVTKPGVAAKDGGVSAGMRWVAATIAAQTIIDNRKSIRRSPGTQKSVASLAKNWGLSPRQYAWHLAESEDGGLITVHGPRFGRTTPLRTAHRRPVPTARRTQSARKPSSKAPGHMTASEPLVESEEPPF